jgi:hypothetical protein
MSGPADALARLQNYIRPGARVSTACVENWQLPPFETYEDMKDWLKEAVLSARMYEAFPDGRWTIELLLKEQEPGTTYRIRL